MSDLLTAELLGPELEKALRERGFAQLTAVQEAVLDPALEGRDLRLTSQTGSGKTVAIGLVLRKLLQGETRAQGGVARPRALVVTPTRELAHQVEEELSWLYAGLGLLVVTTTGGSSGQGERRNLARGPAVVVGTPGRLLDHLSRKAIDASQVAAVVLDEADRMLDLGFREDLKAILAYPPEAHRTHLVSATFPNDVRALADSVQDDPAHVEGTRLGAANVDIVHHIVLVDSREKIGALVNILLAAPDEQALVFARTRADVANLARQLSQAKFTVGALSGEMDQTARNRAMAAFKNGSLRVMVATDVAARGIDVQNVGHVIHADPPGDADTYTHRSGRTGRAGRKGRSSVLVTPSALRGVSMLLRRAGVAYVVEPVPSADEIRAAADERLVASFAEGDESAIPPRIAALAARLASSSDTEKVIARLLVRVREAESAEPVDVRRIEPPPAERTRSPGGRHDLPRAPTHGLPLPRPSRPRLPSASGRGRATEGEPADHPPPRQRLHDDREWARFRITWGSDRGADARRLLAIVCRRGDVRGSDVGAIRIGTEWSTVEVDARVASKFAEAAGAPDPREPGVVIRPDRAPTREPTDDRAPPRPYTRRSSAPRRDSGGDRPPPRAHSPRTSPQGRDSAGERPAPRAYTPRTPPPRSAPEPHYKGARTRQAEGKQEHTKRPR